MHLFHFRNSHDSVVNTILLLDKRIDTVLVFEPYAVFGFLEILQFGKHRPHFQLLSSQSYSKELKK